MSDVTVVLPTIAARWGNHMLGRALLSVLSQTQPPASIALALDTRHDGAWVTRQRALQTVQTPWVAFLDDDDEFLPQHLQRLREHADETSADYVFSYFEPVGMGDPLRLFGRPFDPAEPHHTTSVIMVKTELAQSIGFTAPHPGDTVSGEDWRFTLACVQAGARIMHLPERTWRWHYHPHDSRNTSGQPGNW